jgi:hypothetical protein
LILALYPPRLRFGKSTPAKDKDSAKDQFQSSSDISWISIHPCGSKF